ncbi:putative deoxyribonuclease TATDN1 isoform X4 [Cynara cardunculus var. scolymus]|uniref:putative deoxyribonuclease TATDN1 isoform X4 n=1 Tax=Cynara cardunculus var. scolymus TaxID=59895 RepID=UPI000D630FA9|nr:putative deoxyribonuclease TATDN1 isoform X4 [Cynara cardunculus var. scolymus]
MVSQSRLFCTVGVHPTRCNEFDESGDPEKHFQALLSLAKEGVEKGKVVAVGECGLDYDRTHFCSPEIQRKYFERQFELAHLLKLPMFLHMRAAAGDFCDILEQNKQRFYGGVAHSFTGTPEDRDKLLAFSNLFIGINGCSLKTSENLDALKGIPVDRMMIETDSPYCEIKNTHAGKNFIKSSWASKKKEKYDQDCLVKGRNEPCLVRQVLEVVGGCKGVADLNQLSRTLYYNTCSHSSCVCTPLRLQLFEQIFSLCKIAHLVTTIYLCWVNISWNDHFVLQLLRVFQIANNA